MSLRGFTLIESLAASMIVPVVVGGTLAAYVTAARLAQSQDEGATVEALSYARQFLEEARNHVAKDDGWFASQAGQGWHVTPDSLPAPGTTGTSSIVMFGAVRKFCVAPRDCDGDNTTGDCHAVHVRVCWQGIAAGNCPANGDPVPGGDPCE